jgi:hypothetical protein
MGGFYARPELAMEVAVILFQFAGVAALCLCRLLPRTRWSKRGKVAFIVAMIGLGVAGALCGRHDSEFALFAGLTITLLLIGMISSFGEAHSTATTLSVRCAEPRLVS